MKPVIGSLLALAIAVSAAACGRDEPAPTAAAPAPAAPSANDMASQPHPMPSTAPTEVDLSGIEKAEGGMTVADVFAQKGDLQGKPVTVRGKAVKVNADIMGRNWLHVRDGSGQEGTNDLTVTTTGPLPGVGDTVLVTGVVALDQDFGMGYRYPVLVEDAEIVVEASADEPE